MKNIRFIAILASDIATYFKDENGERHSIKIENTNNIITNIKKNSPHKNKIVIVANNPDTHEINDSWAKIRFQSLKLSGFKFKEQILLDNRNAKNAKEIIGNASLIILMGGKIMCQMKFLKKIGLKKLLNNFNGVVIGLSAGTMNMCKNVLNFPEENADLGQPLVTKGFGFLDEFILLHFNGVSYPYQYDGIDVIKDYALPFSYKRDILAIPDGSYIYIGGGNKPTIYGDAYIIRKGMIYKKI